MAHPEEPTLPEDTGQRKNKNINNHALLDSFEPVLTLTEDIHNIFAAAYILRLNSVQSFPAEKTNRSSIDDQHGGPR